jgi:hypothetical protein
MICSLAPIRSAYLAAVSSPNRPDHPSTELQ